MASRYFRRSFIGLAGLVLVACAAPGDVAEAPQPLEPIGDFKLGFAIVVAKDAQRGPLSRPITPEELVASIKPEIEKRFTPYEGEKFYHISVFVEAYVLAVPGVPIVASPSSALILALTIWDDKTGKKLNEEPEQIVVLEKFSTKSLFGSGLTQNKDEQLAGLSVSAARQIEDWMRENIQLFQSDVSPVTSP